MRRVWFATLVLAICALAVHFVFAESSRVAAESRTVTAESRAVPIRTSEQMTGMVSSMLYLPVVGGGYGSAAYGSADSCRLHDCRRGAEGSLCARHQYHRARTG